MKKFIKVPLKDEVMKDYEECVEMMDDGIEKDCSECSMNGGDAFGCMGEFAWCNDLEEDKPC